jgi:hypothetical protein
MLLANKALAFQAAARLLALIVMQHTPALAAAAACCGVRCRTMSSLLHFTRRPASAAAAAAAAVAAVVAVLARKCLKRWILCTTEFACVVQFGYPKALRLLILVRVGLSRHQWWGSGCDGIAFCIALRRVSVVIGLMTVFRCFCRCLHLPDLVEDTLLMCALLPLLFLGLVSRSIAKQPPVRLLQQLL